MTFGIKQPKIDTVATVKEPDGWWIVRRVLDEASGNVADSRLEGPIDAEGPANDRASFLAMQIGDKQRAARREQVRKYSSDNRVRSGKRDGVSAKTMQAMVRLMQKVKD